MTRNEYTVFAYEDPIQIVPATAGWYAMFAGSDDDPEPAPYHVVPVACWAVVPVQARRFRTRDNLRPEFLGESPMGRETVGLTPGGAMEADLVPAAEAANFVCYCPPGRDLAEYWDTMTAGICSECLAGRHENCTDKEPSK